MGTEQQPRFRTYFGGDVPERIVNISLHLINEEMRHFLRTRASNLGNWSENRYSDQWVTWTWNQEPVGNRGVITLQARIRGTAIQAQASPPEDSAYILSMAMAENTLREILEEFVRHIEKQVETEEVIPPALPNQKKQTRGPYTDTPTKIETLLRLREESIRGGEVKKSLDVACDEVRISRNTVVNHAPELVNRWKDANYKPSLSSFSSLSSLSSN